MTRLHLVAIATVALLAIQLIGKSVTNPPPSRELAAPEAVESILRRGCYDCHSNQTLMPWYAHVAPVSWLIAHDVRDGRKHLNFSTWDVYADDPGTAAGKLRKVGKVTLKGSMPPWYYATMHPRARLTRADRGLIADWAARRAAELGNAGDSASQ